MRKEANEIDLLELMAKIYNLLRRNIYIILAFVILGLIAGIYKSTSSDPYYETRMIAKSPLSNTEVLNQLQALTELKKNKSYVLLSQELNITEEQAKKIKTLIAEKPEEEDSHLMQIKLEIFDNNLIPKIKQGIIHYLETNQYIKRELKNRQEHYEEYLDKITEALQILREQENKKNLPQAAKEILVSDESYSGQIIQLMNKKGNIESKLIRNQPLIIIKDFYEPQNPQKDISIQIAIYLGIGLILGIIVVFGITLIRKLETYRKNSINQ
jgi:hypothetical protein